MNFTETQKRVLQNKIDKGFNITDINKEFCLLYGEVAEAYDAFRKKVVRKIKRCPIWQIISRRFGSVIYWTC